jgi:hypothetical protein
MEEGHFDEITSAALFNKNKWVTRRTKRYSYEGTVQLLYMDLAESAVIRSVVSKGRCMRIPPDLEWGLDQVWMPQYYHK